MFMNRSIKNESNKHKKNYFNGMTKRQHSKNVKNAIKGSEWSLREVGYLGLITLCEY